MRKIPLKDVHYSNWVVYNGKPIRIGLAIMPNIGNLFFYIPFNESIIDRCDSFIKIKKNVYIFEQGKYTLFISETGTASVFLSEGLVFVSCLYGISDIQNLYPFLSGGDSLDITVKNSDVKFQVA